MDWFLHDIGLRHERINDDRKKKMKWRVLKAEMQYRVSLAQNVFKLNKQHIA